MRSKSEFRALRELCGLTQAALAQELHVEVRSVKRWESELASQSPPQDAWEVLDQAREQQQRVISFAIEKARESEAQRVRLPYWTSEADYVSWSTDLDNGVYGDWRMANANLRAAAIILEHEDYEVEFASGNPVRAYTSEK